MVKLSHQLGIALHNIVGMKKRDVLSTCLGNYMELIPVMLGVGLIGGIVNTANPAYTVRELVHQFNACKTQIVLTTADIVNKIRTVMAQCKLIQVSVKQYNHFK